MYPKDMVCYLKTKSLVRYRGLLYRSLPILRAGPDTHPEQGSKCDAPVPQPPMCRQVGRIPRPMHRGDPPRSRIGAEGYGWRARCRRSVVVCFAGAETVFETRVALS